MIRIHRLANRTLTTEEQPAAILPPAKGEQAWIEVVAPNPQECELLTKGLGVHELAIDDALTVGHPPKFEIFNGEVFLIVHTPDADSEEGTRKIAIVLAKDWIVTMLLRPLPRLDDMAARVRRDPTHYLNAPAVLAHEILEVMNDGIELLVEQLRERVEEIEDVCTSRPHASQMGRILTIRQESARLARTVRTQRDVYALLYRADHPSLPKKVQPYLRDLYDHILRMSELLEGVRDGIAAARDAYFASVNTRLNEVMRTLAAVATIMMPFGILTGVFGMNFDVMPLLHTPTGFWLSMLLMGLLAVALYAVFRWRKWL